MGISHTQYTNLISIVWTILKPKSGFNFSHPLYYRDLRKSYFYSSRLRDAIHKNDLVAISCEYRRSPNSPFGAANRYTDRACNVMLRADGGPSRPTSSSPPGRLFLNLDSDGKFDRTEIYEQRKCAWMWFVRQPISQCWKLLCGR